MDSLYSRYANALLSIAIDENKVEYYKNEIKMLRKVFLEDKDILHLLSSYFLLFEEKEKVIDKIYPNNENIQNFIKIIVKNKRVGSLIKIFDEFIKSCNENMGVKDGIVYSITELAPKEISKIEEGISKKLNYKVELENIVDKIIIEKLI